MPEFQRFSYDVLVIGAGGAGLRAAIEAGAAGAKVGVVCKSLLGKAHTVMAEGGIAAALANVDDRDNWRVHFADTMRGGQYLNNWRMAELHAGKRRNVCANSRRGALSSIARLMAKSCNETSADTGIPGWRTLATAPAWR
jgi:succinate dehydrogenase/fumarate reductase flavoprotein subunit